MDKQLGDCSQFIYIYLHLLYAGVNEQLFECRQWPLYR